MKKVWLIAMVTILILAVMGVYTVANRMFPKAEPMSIPAAESVVSVSVAQNNDPPVAVAMEGLEELLRHMGNAQPTRILSVQDYPAVRTYFTVELVTSQRICRYFVYEENGRVYLEAPYEGIYRAERPLLDLLASQVTPLIG